MHRRTSVSDLAAPFLFLVVAAYLIVRFAYGDIPPLQYSVPVPLAVLAVIEFIVARRVRSAVRHVPDARPMTALAIARAVALGKSSALVGAGLAGIGVGVLAWVAPQASSVRAASSDLAVAISLAAASVLLVAAGLALERAGIDPGRTQERAE